MILNYVLISFRGFFRNQILTAISVAGLGIALTCCILIFLWASHELSFDKFHKDNDRIFQVFENQSYSNGEILTNDGTPAPLVEKLQNDFPDVELATHYSWPRQMLFTNGKKSIYHEGFFADTSFLKIFTFNLLEGDAAHLLDDVKSVVITKKMADKYFLGQSAIGKILRADNDWDLTVTGVVADIPTNSSIWFDFILPFDLYAKRATKPQDWSNHSVFTFVKLKNGVSETSFSTKAADVLASTHTENNNVNIFLFPLTKLRLYWDFENGAPTGSGRIKYIAGLSLFAFLILVTACVNLINLTTAKAASRAKEVGIRKVAGSSRKDLIRQFLTESMLLSLLSLFASLVLVNLFLPLFNYLVGKELEFNFGDPHLLIGLLGMTLFTGFLSGGYPALLLSAYKPATVLRRNLFSSNDGIGARKALVFLQFCLSTILIIGAVTFNSQLQYMLTKDLGFDKENLVYFNPQPGSLKNIESFKAELLKNPFIEAVGQGYDNPLNINNNDGAQWDGIPINETVTVQTTVCDQDYIKAVGLTLKAGRHFYENLAADSLNFIINETCALQMGFENPIGQEIKVYKTKGRVIGVVKDFHHRDFQSSIAPLIFVAGKPKVKPMTVFIRIAPGGFVNATEYLQKIYKKFEPNFPLQLSFMEKDIRNFLFDALAVGQLAIYLTIMIVFISALGLFGLTLFAIERKTKEIGIRKVLGATWKHIVLLLSKDFFTPIIASLAVAIPIGYYLSTQWLQEFAFHVAINEWWFIGTIVMIFSIVILTVGFQATKATQRNPTESLRSE
jgi:putative ABC transport system permease protein